jgi:tetratricopeptide (TPR) repeat protein
LWSEVFDGKTNQLLNLQDKISARVLDSLNQNRQQTLELAQRPTQNDDAYTAYLKGRYFGRRSDEKSLRKAMEFYDQAIKLDSQFSESYAALADAQYRLFNALYDTSTENVQKAKANLEKALTIKSDSVSALLTLGLIQNTYDWDWKKSEETFKRAIAIAPQSPGARMRYGMLLTYLRRFDEARVELEKAVQLDPTYSGGYTNLGTVYYCQKDYPKAVELYQKTLELDEKWVFAHWYLSRTLWMQGHKTESLKYVVSGLKLGDNENLARQIEQNSQTQTPEEVTRFLIEQWSQKPDGGSSPSIATRSIFIGDRERALLHLEKSFNEHNPWTVIIKALPEFEPLQNEPRFQEILRKMNLP